MSSFGNRVLPSFPSDRNSHTVSSDGKGGCDDVRWELPTVTDLTEIRFNPMNVCVS